MTDPRTKAAYAGAALAATMLTPRIVNAAVKASHGRDVDRLVQLQTAKRVAQELVDKLELVELQVSRARRQETGS